MALPSSITLVPVAGNYVDFEGTPISGQIKFTLSDVLNVGADNKIVVPSTKSVTLDANGSLSTSLPSTNDPDVSPTYLLTVEEAFPSGRTYTISLPYTTSGTLNLADISPLPIPPDTYVGLVSDTLWNALAAGIDALDVTINQANGKFVFILRYRYLEAGYASYTALNAPFATYTALQNGAFFEAAPSYFTSYETQAINASNSSSASVSSAQSAAAGVLNSFLLYGG